LVYKQHVIWRKLVMALNRVLVVGAGVMGSSIAFNLARMRAGEVVVLEKKHVAAGNTAKSSGLVRLHYTNEPEARLAYFSYLWFRHWDEMVGGHCGFVATGFLRLVHPADVERLRANVAMLQRVGVNTYLVDRQEIVKLEPRFSNADVELAAYEPDSGYADPPATAYSFMSAARDLGAQLKQGVAVKKIVLREGRAVGVETEEGLLEADAIVLATNAWTPGLLEASGLSLDIAIVPERHRVGVVGWPEPMGRPHLTCIDGIQNMYFRPETGDLTLVGTGAAQPHVDPDNYDEGVEPSFMAEVAEKISYRVPRLAEGQARRGIAGVYDMSPDSKPLLGPMPGVEGLYVAAGFSGTGFKLSPAVGVGMAELVVKGKAQTVDLEPFRLTRFAEGKPLVGQYEYRGGVREPKDAWLT
jgi:sarcosine oxidase subunit beta